MSNIDEEADPATEAPTEAEAAAEVLGPPPEAS